MPARVSGTNQQLAFRTEKDRRKNHHQCGHAAFNRRYRTSQKGPPFIVLRNMTRRGDSVNFGNFSLMVKLLPGKMDFFLRGAD